MTCGILSSKTGSSLMFAKVWSLPCVDGMVMDVRNELIAV